MKILVINCGSSTLKFELFKIEPAGAEPEFESLARGIVDRFGDAASFELRSQGSIWQETLPVADHGEASRIALDKLSSKGLLKGDELDGVGHRVIHGGDRFSEPAIIDDEIMAAIAAFAEFAPLHNKASLNAIRSVRKAIGPAVPMVAVFDTAFHRTLPESAYRYAIPLELADKHHIRRFGFHGLAHRYMMERYSAMTGIPLQGTRLVTLQMGNGCSATAIKNGQSVDTSMGFTPLEGLIMGTRSGDVDPMLPGFLARQENTDIETAEGWLNAASGLLGISGRSEDMRELLEAQHKGDRRASLAIEMFCYRIKKYIGAYMTILGGMDALLFGGGIGENSPEVRARICSGLEWCGLRLDKERNSAPQGKEVAIQAADSRISAYVVRVDEAIIVARDTVACLTGDSGKENGR
jgi:acetate kinase